jgi:hypothetical protein
MDFRALALGLVCAVPIAITASAQTGERSPTLAFGVDGSVPLSTSDTTYRNPKGRSDYLTSPYLRLSASGKLVPDLSYSFYGSGGFEKYPFRQDADNTYASLGTTLTKRWDQLSTGISYERNYAYDGVFGRYLYASNDVGIYSSYGYTDAAKIVRLRPGFSVSRRFADDPSEDSFVYSFKLDAERKLSDRWWVTLTPRIRRQHFLAGESDGRADTIYSISTGVRYKINDHFQVSAGIGYDHRESTAETKRYDSFSFGMSLDFSHTFASFPPDSGKRR